MKTILILFFFSFGAYSKQNSHSEKYYEVLNKFVEQSPELKRLGDELDDINVICDRAADRDNKITWKYDKIKREYNEERRKLDQFPKIRQLKNKNKKAKQEYLGADKKYSKAIDQLVKQSPKIRQVKDKYEKAWQEYDRALDEYELTKEILEDHIWEKFYDPKAGEILVGLSPKIKKLRDEMNKADKKYSNLWKKYRETVDESSERSLKLNSSKMKWTKLRENIIKDLKNIMKPLMN